MMASPIYLSVTPDRSPIGRAIVAMYALRNRISAAAGSRSVRPVKALEVEKGDGDVGAGAESLLRLIDQSADDTGIQIFAEKTLQPLPPALRRDVAKDRDNSDTLAALLVRGSKEGRADAQAAAFATPLELSSSLWVVSAS